MQPAFDVKDRPVLVAAAWLHDVGYNPAVVSTGLHALDGARWLRMLGTDERIACLVALWLPKITSVQFRWHAMALVAARAYASASRVGRCLWA
jgi:hypothetical protein